MHFLPIGSIDRLHILAYGATQEKMKNIDLNDIAWVTESADHFANCDWYRDYSDNRALELVLEPKATQTTE